MKSDTTSFDPRPYYSTMVLIRMPVNENEDNPDPHAGFGTGFIVGDNGLVFTVRHNLINPDTNKPYDWVWICFYNETVGNWTSYRRVEIDPVFLDDTIDAAILKIFDNLPKVRELPLSLDWKRGDEVCVLGFEKQLDGKSYMLEPVTCSIAEIWPINSQKMDVFKREKEKYLHLNFTDNNRSNKDRILLGFSGGPLINCNLKPKCVIGIVKAINLGSFRSNPFSLHNLLVWYDPLIKKLPKTEQPFIYGQDQSLNSEDGSSIKPSPRSSQPVRIQIKCNVSILYRDDDEEEGNVKLWINFWLVRRLKKHNLKIKIIPVKGALKGVNLTYFRNIIKASHFTILVLTPTLIKGGLGDVENLLIQNYSLVGFDRSILPLLLRRCTGLPTQVRQKGLDFTDVNQWETQLQKLVELLGVQYFPIVLPDRDIVIPTIRYREKPSQQNINCIMTSVYNGTLGKLLPNLNNQDIVEIFFIAKSDDENFIIWLNLHKTDETFVFKIGQKLKLEIENYNENIPKDSNSNSSINFFPSLNKKSSEADIVLFEVSLHKSEQITTFAQILNNQKFIYDKHAILNLNNWVKRIFNDLDKLNNKKSTTQEKDVNYTHIYNKFMNFLKIIDVFEKSIEGSRGDVWLEVIFSDAFKNNIKPKFIDIYNKDKPVWRHFGYTSERMTPLGVAHGNLCVSNIMVVHGNNPHNDNDGSKLWTFDYQYIRNHYPLNKDHASLEASIWFDIIFNHFKELSDIADLFIRILCASRVYQFQVDVSKNIKKQTLAGMIMQIRERALNLYQRESLTKEWWPQYLELLYHELLIKVEEYGFKDIKKAKSQSSQFVKLYMFLSFLSDLIDKWHPIKK